jgi:ketosteroid isomerase-like protein
MHSGGSGRESGAPVEQSWTNALRVRDGKVVRIEFHADRETALEAVGLLE